MSNTTNKLENDMNNSVKALQKCYTHLLANWSDTKQTLLADRIQATRLKLRAYETKISDLKEKMREDNISLTATTKDLVHKTSYMNKIRTIIEKHPSITIEQFHDNDGTTDYDDVLGVYCTLLEGDSDPYDCQHACFGLQEAHERCLEYVEHIKQLEEV